MAQHSLLESLVTCPACERQVPLVRVNPKFFVVDDRDTDGHILAYRWIPGVRTDLLPHLYKAWQCPECQFADHEEHLKEFHKTFKAGYTLSAFRRASDRQRQVLRYLADMVPEGEMNHMGAIARFLSVIFVLQLPEESSKVDHARLAAMALRLAWLYREVHQGKTVYTKDAGSTLGRMGGACESLETLIKDAQDLLDQLKHLARQRSIELNLPGGDDENPYFAATDALQAGFEEVHATFANLQLAVLQDQHGELNTNLFEDPSLHQELERTLVFIASLWPGLPRNERQALELAVEALEYSYEFEGIDQGVEESLAMAELILDLLIRLNELDRALDWSTTITKAAHDSRTDIQHRIKHTQMSNHDARMQLRKASAANLVIQKVGERRRAILQLMVERDQPRIQEMLSQTHHLPLQQQTQAMLAAGFRDGVISLVMKDLHKTPKPAKATWGLGSLVKRFAPGAARP